MADSGWQSHFARAVSTFDFDAMQLPVSPGVTIDGKPLVFDLANAPHLLLGGTPGSGKSVCLNALLLEPAGSMGNLAPLAFRVDRPEAGRICRLAEICRQLFGEL